MPSVARTLGGSHGSGAGKRRPDAFVEAAEDHQVGALQPRFEQAPDEDARMPAIRRAHRALVEQLAKQRHGIFGRDGQPLAPLATPAARRAARRPSARPARARPRRRQALAPPRRAAPAKSRQAASARASNPSSRCDAVANARSSARIAFFVGEMRVEPGEPRRRARAAQREVERAHVLEPGEPLVALAADQRMLEQRQQRHRRELLGGGRRDAEQQGAGGGLRQRLAGAVVGLDAPAREQRRNAPRELPVGRDQRRGLARRLQRLAQRERDRLRLRGRIGKLGQRGCPLSRRSAGCKRLPFVREIRRRHRVGDRPRCAPAARPRRPDQRQRCTSPRATPIRSSSSFRWNCGCVASPRPFSSGPERVPFLVREDVRRATGRAARPSRPASARRARRAPRPPAPRW